MSYIYLASPYTDKLATVMALRYKQVAESTAHLLRREIHVYSPIVHCHEIAVRHNLPKGFDFWQRYNKTMLEASGALWILQLEGWSESKGVQWEISHANKINLPIKMLMYPLRELNK